ncbi:MAG: BatA domain-containing protein [Verrucomicrobia bacterium]|nr:BatA domain-containing protein [Verrucomicrobiota bacterium]
MTFLQPFVLWALPLILLPVIIHLLNRLRHRSQPWAAMRFLLSATRSSTGHAKLRQFLILLFRVLAVLMLVLFIGRPLAGGWVGWALSPAPDAVLILLDRSASMEAQAAGATTTKREQALKLVAQAAKEFEETSHLVLIDSALRAPQEVAKAASLSELTLTAPTDTAADIPAMLQSAVNWLIENRAGTAEIWIASDLQRSNWQPDDTRWKNVIAQLASLKQKVRVRLLASNQATDNDTSIATRETVRRKRGEQSDLQLVADFQRTANRAETIPLTLILDGARSQFDVTMDSQALRWRNKTELGDKKGGGWGALELPADANRRNNTTYFVYGTEMPLRARIVSSEPQSARFLQLAAGILGDGAPRSADLLSPASTTSAVWDDNTLIVWQAPLPEGVVAERVRKFAEEGGAVIFLPPAQAETTRFGGVGWGEVQSAETDKSFRIVRWDEEQGPLAKSDEGMSLALPQVTFQKRQLISGQKTVLAAFEDGTPFLTRQTLGRGEVYFCASLPRRDWSSLGDGTVLVPMMQRLLLSGSRRLQQASSIMCGELSVGDQGRRWETVDAVGLKDIRTQAGVYRSGERLVAVNRPLIEDDLEVVETSEATRLFSDLPFQMLQERRTQNDSLQGEVWRLFVFAMLAFLIAEGILILPARTENSSSTAPRPLAKPPAETRVPEMAA